MEVSSLSTSRCSKHSFLPNTIQLYTDSHISCPSLHQCFRNPKHLATLLLRALGAGIMLALAIIHIIPEGIEMIGELIDYPAGACATLFGIIVMIVAGTLSRYIGGKSGKIASETGLQKLELESRKSPSKALPSDGEVVSSASVYEGHYGAHTHYGASLEVDLKEELQPSSQDAYMFELGCVIHSFLIGEIFSMYDPSCCTSCNIANILLECIITLYVI